MNVSVFTYTRSDILLMVSCYEHNRGAGIYNVSRAVEAFLSTYKKNSKENVLQWVEMAEAIRALDQGLEVNSIFPKEAVIEMEQAMKDLDAMRSMAARFDKAKTQQAIRAGEYQSPAEHPRTMEAGRGHVRGTRYRGRTKSK